MSSQAWELRGRGSYLENSGRQLVPDGRKQKQLVGRESEGKHKKRKVFQEVKRVPKEGGGREGRQKVGGI